MTVHNITTGSLYLDATGRAFQTMGEQVYAEYFDYPRYRQQGTRCQELQRLFQDAAVQLTGKAFLNVANALEKAVAHPFFYPEGLGRPEFLGFLEALEGAVKALREGREQVVIWAQLGVAYTELAHAVPNHFSTYPRYESN